MGIGDGLEGTGAEVDCSVGTIVWVRRRNGSWWPGKILGPEELSASHLMSPRSGTPVKLLGREDASVDWYNLEKSKRVKAFRCGEFDDCIEKAEKSQGASIKKREKYARREDAILHALELERLQLEKKQKKLGTVNCLSTKLPPVLKRERGAPSEHLGNNHPKLVNLKSQSLLKGPDSSVEEESMRNLLHSQKAKPGKQSSWDDDNSEAMPRMRGLQDFGLKIASKGKLSVSEGSRKAHSDDNHVPDLPSGTRSMEGVSHVPSNKTLLAVKRKAPGSLMEEFLGKRRDRRRPLVQVLQSSAKLPVSHSLQSDGDVSLSVQGEKEQTGGICRAKRSRCVYLPAESGDCLGHSDFPSDQRQSDGIDNCHPTPGSLMEENASLTDDTESDSSETERDYLNLEMDEEMAVHSDSTRAMAVAEPRIPGRYMTNDRVQGQTESMSSEDFDDSVANGYMSQLHPHDQIAAGAADLGVSKWQLKGKRNTRNLMKRPMEVGGKISNGSAYGTYLESKGNGLKRRSLGHSLYRRSDSLNYDYDEDELIEKSPVQAQMSGFGNRGYPSVLKGAFKDIGRSNTDIIESEEDPVWEAEGLPQAGFRGYWDESAEYNPMYGGQHLDNGKDSVLVDVEVKARASYQGEHVPLVSLMSRLNGKAIIGHPIQIEVLEDGASDVLLPTHDDFSGEPMGNDGSTKLTPVWRTARRTAMHRVPRPHPSTTLNDDEGGDPSQYSDPEGKALYKKPHAGNPYLKVRKSFRPSERKISKKPIKKVSLSSQKTRTLSSIAIDQKSSGKAGNLKLSNKSNGLDGLIKPENGLTTVTCIPVKLVYSRLLEAVGRPPSRPVNHSVSINGNTERKPCQTPM